jgi:sugar phosphate isomerase/epimerase
MQIGIMTGTFARPTLAETLDAVRAHGLASVQFDLAGAGLASMPERIDGETCDRIRREFVARGVTMAAISGTFNMIHPDLEERRRGLLRLRALAGACERLGTSVITLCTGTRDPTSMWRRHPENDSQGAWEDLLPAMREAARIAEECRVTVAFEPEVSNVVDSARKARRLLDEIASPHLKVVIDGANLFHAGELPRMREILDEAFALLGREIVLAHAKDLSRDGEAGHDAAGTGLLDYDCYLALLRETGFTGSLILHSLQEAQVPGCVSFLRAKLAGATGSPGSEVSGRGSE